MNPRRSGNETASSTTAELVELLRRTRANMRPVVSTSMAAENSTDTVVTRTAEDSANTRDPATAAAMFRWNRCIARDCLEASWMGAAVCPRHMTENLRGLEGIAYGAEMRRDSRTYRGFVPLAEEPTVTCTTVYQDRYGEGRDLRLTRSESRMAWELNWRGRMTAFMDDRTIVQARNSLEFLKCWILDTCRVYGLHNDGIALIRALEANEEWAEIRPRSHSILSR